MVSKGNIHRVYLTHQIASESLHDLSDVPILQSLSDLRIIVGHSAANLLGCQGIAHRRVGAEWWWFEFEFEYFVAINNLVMCSDCQFKLS